MKTNQFPAEKQYVTRVKSLQSSKHRQLFREFRLRELDECKKYINIYIIFYKFWIYSFHWDFIEYILKRGVKVTHWHNTSIREWRGLVWSSAASLMTLQWWTRWGRLGGAPLWKSTRSVPAKWGCWGRTVRSHRSILSVTSRIVSSRSSTSRISLLFRWNRQPKKKHDRSVFPEAIRPQWVTFVYETYFQHSIQLCTLCQASEESGSCQNAVSAATLCGLLRRNCQVCKNRSPSAST